MQIVTESETTVWKFPLRVDDTQTIEMPSGSEVLCVQNQSDTPTLWARVPNVHAPMMERKFHLIGTGHQAGTRDLRQYIGTVQIMGGMLVFHVFES